MIEVYLQGGVCYEAEMKREVLKQIVEDEFINNDFWINTILSDGCKASFKKGSIISFNDVSESIGP